jgi:hypothetical protein
MVRPSPLDVSVVIDLPGVPDMQLETQSAPVDHAGSRSPINCRRLPPSYGSLSLIMEFIVATEEFGGMRAKTLFSALKAQIQGGYHVAAYRDQKLVGYCGWLNTTEDIAEQWLKNAGKLHGIPVASSNAVALTIVRIVEREAVLSIIRSCRQLNGERRVFFKRESRGRRPARKSSVYNN